MAQINIYLEPVPVVLRIFGNADHTAGLHCRRNPQRAQFKAEAAAIRQGIPGILAGNIHHLLADRNGNGTLCVIGVLQNRCGSLVIPRCQPCNIGVVQSGIKGQISVPIVHHINAGIEDFRAGLIKASGSQTRGVFRNLVEEGSLQTTVHRVVCEHIVGNRDCGNLRLATGAAHGRAAAGDLCFILVCIVKTRIAGVGPVIRINTVSGQRHIGFRNPVFRRHTAAGIAPNRRIFIRFDEESEGIAIHPITAQHFLNGIESGRSVGIIDVGKV